MKNLLLVGVLFLSQCLVAQTQDAWVFFTDKEDVQISIDNPISIMTQEAIDRKAMHGVVIDERDVPVNEAYIAQVKAATGITVFAKSKWMNCVYVQGTMANIENLLNLGFVDSVEWADKSLNDFAPGGGTATDKFAVENNPERIIYNYGSAANQIEMIRGEFLHEQDFTGEGMIVAVLDSGFPGWATNPAFSHVVNDGRLLGTYDFFSRTTDVTGTGSHGTQTSSDIGGFIQDQFVGTAPEASFYLFRTEYGPDENPREEAWWVEALERADSLGVDVVNTSLGYQAYDNPAYTHTYADLDGQTTFGARGGNHAFDKGLLLVTSAGNSGNGFGTVGTPGDSPGILTVGAVSPAGFYVNFSSRGPTVDGRIKPDVMAQGQNSAVVDASGNVGTSNGTSFSSPIMAGAVTCLWQASPTSTNAEVMQAVRESAHLFANPTDEMGYGIPNFEDAYNNLLELSVEDVFLEKNFALYPNPVSDVVNISFPLSSEIAEVAVYTIAGELVMEKDVNATDNRIDIASLATGTYLVSVTDGKTSNTFKVIKQ
jgi:hypothetical protein